MMPGANAPRIDLPMPIRTPRLLIRPRLAGDGMFTLPALVETWTELHQWMQWAESLDHFTLETLEARNRSAMAAFLQGNPIELLGIELATGLPVIWCGLHDIDWSTRHCGTGYWVRKSAQRRNFATEATNALLRYAFGALGLRQVSLTHSAGNEASRRIAEKLGFQYQGVERAANPLPGGRMADRIRYTRLDVEGLPPLDVRWGEDE